MTTDIFLGDCLEVMKELPDNFVDMILCDLPYGTTACKWDEIIPFEPLWSAYNRVCKGSVVLFGSEPFSSHLRLANLKDYRYDWVWDKVTARGHLVAEKRPMAQCECISVFYKNPYIYNPQMVKRPPEKIEHRKKTEYNRTEIMGGIENAPTDRVYAEWYPKTLISVSNASSINREHPTQKPVELLSYLIKTYTDKCMIVLDNCMGSGSTGVACVNTERNFIGIEKDEGYFKIAERRIEDAKASRYLIDIVD